MSRIITVFGATGSSVIDAILADGTFIPRAVSRNPSSDSAMKLKARDVEVVPADLWDVESLKKAIAGSEGVFGVTNFFDPSIYPGNVQGEIVQGKNLITAAKEVGVKFFVFSSLPDAAKLSNGKYPNVHHFNNKAAIDECLRESGLPNAILHLGTYAENLWGFGGLVKNPDGSLEVQTPCYSPDALQAFTWVSRDLGPCALALFKNYEGHKDIWNQTFHVVNAQASYTDLAKMIQDGLGKPVSFTSPPTSGMGELDEMFKYQSDIGLFRDSVIPDPRLVALGVKFGSLKEFVETEVKPRFS